MLDGRIHHPNETALVVTWGNEQVHPTDYVHTPRRSRCIYCGANGPFITDRDFDTSRRNA